MAGNFVGTAALVRDPLGWSSHAGVRSACSYRPASAAPGFGRDLLEGIYADAVERGTRS